MHDTDGNTAPDMGDAIRITDLEQDLDTALLQSGRLQWLMLILGACSGLAALAYELLFETPGGEPLREVWLDHRRLFLFLSLSGLVIFGILVGVLRRNLRVISRLHEIVRRQSVTDALTGIHNRHRLFEDLADARSQFDRYATPYAVAVMDLDHFKVVNDTYGHSAGDAVLRAFVDRVRGTLRVTDGFYRYGGEEFVILAPHSNAEELLEVVKRASDKVAATPMRAGGQTINVTASAGIADSGMSAGLAGRPWNLIDLADRAMFYAKEHGRNCVHTWRPAMVDS